MLRSVETFVKNQFHTLLMYFFCLFYGTIQIETTVVYPFLGATGIWNKPKIRFPSLLGVLTPKIVAEHVIDAHRRNRVYLFIKAKIVDIYKNVFFL